VARCPPRAGRTPGRAANAWRFSGLPDIQGIGFFLSCAVEPPPTSSFVGPSRATGTALHPRLIAVRGLGPVEIRPALGPGVPLLAPGEINWRRRSEPPSSFSKYLSHLFLLPAPLSCPESECPENVNLLMAAGDQLRFVLIPLALNVPEAQRPMAPVRIPAANKPVRFPLRNKNLALPAAARLCWCLDCGLAYAGPAL